MFAGNAQQAQLQNTLQKQFQEKIPAYNAYLYGGLAVSFFLSVALLTAGPGLLAMKPWARTLSLVYAGVSLLDKIVKLIVLFLFILPAQEELMKTLAANTNPALPMSFLRIATVVGQITAFLTFIYPTAVLIAMLTPTVRKSLGKTQHTPNLDDPDILDALDARGTGSDLR